MKKIEIDKDLLYRIYIEENHNIQDTANLMNVSYSIIQRAIKENNFNKSQSQIQQQRKNLLKEKYGVENTYQLDKSKEKSKETKLERYGSETYNNSKQQKQTMKEKYGVSCGYNLPEVQNKIKSTYGGLGYASTIIRDKIKQTNQERYGVDYPLQNKDILEKSLNTQRTNNNGKLAWNTEKSAQTKLERYGNTLGFGSSNTLATMQRKYGVKYTVHNKELFEKMKTTNLKRYGVEYACLTDNCLNRNRTTISIVNKNFKELLESNGIKVEMEFKIKNRSYDFHVLNSNILIEINPTYTHNSTKSPHFISRHSKPLDKTYHYNKCKLAIDNGYQLISIFDWMNVEKVIDIIKAKLHLLSNRVFANKCKVKEITRKEANEFLNKYHIQNSATNQSVCIGLYYQDELVQVQTFGKSRYNTKVEWEAIRLASKFDTYIIGGVSKGFNYFVKKYNPTSIISYNSLNISTGGTDDLQGFKFKGYSKSQGVWINTKKNDNPFMIRNSSLRFIGIDKLLGKSKGDFPDYDGTYETSNEALIIKEGYVEVFDCGNITYIWNREEA